VKPYHTKLDNLLIDFVIPHLNEGETKCLLYIIRRTVGFQDKEWDRISLSQFEKGIKNGDYVFDTGTGMSRPSIIKALSSLVEKNLVAELYSCSNCLWSGPGQPRMRCPRCQRSCEKSYRLVPQSSRTITQFLNKYDREGRLWNFNPGMMRFQAEESEPEATLPITRETLEDYVGKIWHPELLAAIIKQGREGSSGKKFTHEQLLKWYYLPMIDLQVVSTEHPPALKYALQETLDKRIPGQGREVVHKDGTRALLVNRTWPRYARAIIQSQLTRRQGDPLVQGARSEDIPALSAWANSLLERARTLNEHNEGGQARELLSELLGRKRELAQLFGNDLERADYAIRWAYKIGEADLKGALENTAPVYDYYPEWPSE
jgi:hypothetical protein